MARKKWHVVHAGYLKGIYFQEVNILKNKLQAANESIKIRKCENDSEAQALFYELCPLKADLIQFSHINVVLLSRLSFSNNKKALNRRHCF